VGHNGEEKIKILFQRANVPVWERRGWPIIVRCETILWARRFGPAAQYAYSGSGAILAIRDQTL
jgi:tRNA(Ile)-lysidine synthase